MIAQPAPDLIGWVRAGERIFGAVLQTLQEHEWHRTRADRLEQENRQLQDEIEVIRAELAAYRAERVEGADTLSWPPAPSNGSPGAPTRLRRAPRPGRPGRGRIARWCSPARGRCREAVGARRGAGRQPPAGAPPGGRADAAP